MAEQASWDVRSRDYSKTAASEARREENCAAEVREGAELGGEFPEQ